MCFIFLPTQPKTKHKPWCSYGGVMNGSLSLQQEGWQAWDFPFPGGWASSLCCGNDSTCCLICAAQKGSTRWESLTILPVLLVSCSQIVVGLKTVVRESCGYRVMGDLSAVASPQGFLTWCQKKNECLESDCWTLGHRRLACIHILGDRSCNTSSWFLKLHCNFVSPQSQLGTKTFCCFINFGCNNGSRKNFICG